MSDRPSENLLSRLEQSLRQSRAARMRLAARLRELEVEADSVRAELAEMDTLATQSEAAIYRLLTSVLASGNLSGSNFSGGLPSDAELEAAMQPRPQQARAPFTVDSRRQEIPPIRPNTDDKYCSFPQPQHALPQNRTRHIRPHDSRCLASFLVRTKRQERQHWP